MCQLKQYLTMRFTVDLYAPKNITHYQSLSFFNKIRLLMYILRLLFSKFCAIIQYNISKIIYISVNKGNDNGKQRKRNNRIKA